MMTNFREWLKRERKLRNLSIRKLSELSNYSHSQVAKVERGESIVTWAFCEDMARIFNQPVWKLFVMAGLLEYLPEDAYKDEKKRVLVSSFDELPDAGKDELLRYAAWLVHQHRGAV